MKPPSGLPQDAFSQGGVALLPLPKNHHLRPTLGNKTSRSEEGKFCKKFLTREGGVQIRLLCLENR